MSQEVRLEGQLGIELMVERAVAGRVAVKPAAAGGGGPQGQALRWLVGRGESPVRDERSRALSGRGLPKGEASPHRPWNQGQM
jgi:hypothetical protein